MMQVTANGRRLTVAFLFPLFLLAVAGGTGSGVDAQNATCTDVSASGNTGIDLCVLAQALRAKPVLPVDCGKRSCVPSDCCDTLRCVSEYAAGVFTCDAVSHVTLDADRRCANGCDASICCDPNPLCATHNCRVGYEHARPGTASASCSNVTCSDSDCCDPNPTCATAPNVICSGVNDTLVDNAGARLCRSAVCQDTRCCQPTAMCGGFDCATLGTASALMPVPRTIAHPRQSSLRCRTAVCEVEECCVPRGTCSASVCDDVSVLRAGASATPYTCASHECVNADCCEPRGKCAAYSCQQYTDTVLCAGVACTSAECCDAKTVGVGTGLANTGIPDDTEPPDDVAFNDNMIVAVGVLGGGVALVLCIIMVMRYRRNRRIPRPGLDISHDGKDIFDDAFVPPALQVDSDDETQENTMSKAAVPMGSVVYKSESDCEEDSD